MKLLRKLAEMVRDQRGVTLIELLAVIVILGIIAAIGVPALMDSRDKAQQETYNTNAKIMTEAAKRKILMGETYMDSVSEDDKEFNLEELLTEASIAYGSVTEATPLEDEEGEEGGDEEIVELGNAFAFVDENDESKGTYDLNVTEGTVVYNPEGGIEEEEEETTDEVDAESITDDGQTFDVEREPVNQ